MNDLLLFEREEVQFIHDDEDFVYSFHCFDSGKITFKRLWPATKESEIVIFPGGQKALANTAIIVLYKAAASGQQLSGFLPNVLRRVLDMYISKDALLEHLGRAITNFQVKSPICQVEKVMEFVGPYAPWMVCFLQMLLIIEYEWDFS
jgi:hypothetical protein